MLIYEFTSEVPGSWIKISSIVCKMRLQKDKGPLKPVELRERNKGDEDKYTREEEREGWRQGGKES